jgi:hypothetical protein
MKLALVLLVLICMGNAVAAAQTFPETRDFNGWLIYNTTNSPLTDNELMTLTLDRDDNAWIGTAKGRVIKFDRHNWNVYRFYSDKDTIIHGDSNVIIVGSDREVISPVQALTVDTNNNIWMGWNGGVRKFTGNWNEITSTGSELDEAVTSIEVAPDQTIWFAVSNRWLARYNSSGWSIMPAVPYITVKRLAIDRNGNPTIIHDDPYYPHVTGLGKYDGSSWSTFKPADMGFTTDGFGEDFFGALTVDKRGDLWIAAGDGVARWRNGERTIFKYPSNISRVNAVDFDPSGNLWLGTATGLVKYDFSTTTYYTVENSGLPNRDVTGVKVDRNGVVWMSTWGGLALFDPKGVLDVPQGSNDMEASTLQAGISPNAITDRATIHVHSNAHGSLHVSLGNSLGRETAVVYDGELDAGDHAIGFDATGIPAGTYFLRVGNGAHVLTLPVMVLH